MSELRLLARCGLHRPSHPPYDTRETQRGYSWMPSRIGPSISIEMAQSREDRRSDLDEQHAKLTLRSAEGLIKAEHAATNESNHH